MAVEMAHVQVLYLLKLECCTVAEIGIILQPGIEKLKGGIMVSQILFPLCL